ncbi:MAG: hypothetical protein JWO11_4143 [Nocardioides sp.]|nr:hypothetical protein [Nocardioides sp.]
MTAQPCDHAGAVPVESVITGETLAALCPGCDVQLPAEFIGCPHANVIDAPTLGEPPGRRSCNDCGTTGWYPNRTGMSYTNAETLTGLVRAGFTIPSISNMNVPTSLEIREEWQRRAGWTSCSQSTQTRRAGRSA